MDDPSLRIGLLGPLVLQAGEHSVDVRGGRRRALLALLALESGRTVGADRLVEALWPDEPPENAVQALYSHVSRLRGQLGPLAHRLQRQGAGYRLHLEPEELDVDVARRLARASSYPATAGADAAASARAALSLWRGPALEEFRAVPALEIEAVGLEELRLQLVDDLLEARLALGDRGVAVDAAAAAAASPLRERTTLLLVRALAADGRSADAMATAQGFRRRLADETGLDPGPALAELEQQVAAGTLAAGGEPVLAATPWPVARPDGPFVGRRQDREEVLRLIGGHATVTITGPGGVGKTRLALDVAADPDVLPAGSAVPGDVVVVDLAAVDRGDRLCQAVASTLGLRTVGELRASDVAASLAGRPVLLVLDNCEHLLEPCRELVTTLSSSAPGTRVLATSRVTLHVPGEYVVRLQPLPVPRAPSDLGTLRRQPGVRAFLEHARRRRPGFDVSDGDAEDLVEVLRRLDGLPLGIELAARQVAVMPLAAVRERLDRALDLETGRGAPGGDRQGTLRATIGSSYRLLSEPEQRLLRSLAVFPGGTDLATVEALARVTSASGDPLDVLHRLVDASLLVADATTGRCRMLFTVRTFLLDELERLGEREEAERRFLDRCLQVADEIGAAAAGPAEPEADRRLRAELDNFRAARDAARLHGREDVVVELTLALTDPCLWRDLREVWTWALELAADPALSRHPDRVRLLGCAAEAARLLGDLDRATALAEEAIDAAGPDADPALLDRAWGAWGSVAHFRGDFTAARERWLRGARGRPFVAGVQLASAALAAAYGGDRAAARELLGRAHLMHSRTGTASHLAYAAYVEGELLTTEDVEGALACYGRAIDGARHSGATFVEGVARVARASALTRTGDLAGAAEEFRSLLMSWHRSGQTTQLWTTARNAAALLADAGHRRTAGLLLVCADAQPGAARVSPSIARYSTRTYLPLDELLDADEVAQVRAQAAALGPAGVLHRAEEELGLLAGTLRRPAP